VKVEKTEKQGAERLLPKENESVKIKELIVAPVKAESSENLSEKVESFKQKLADRLERMKETKQIETEVKKPDKDKLALERNQMGKKENDSTVERMNSGKDVSFSGWVSTLDLKCRKAKVNVQDFV